MDHTFTIPFCFEPIPDGFKPVIGSVPQLQPIVLCDILLAHLNIPNTDDVVSTVNSIFDNNEIINVIRNPSAIFEIRDNLLFEPLAQIVSESFALVWAYEIADFLFANRFSVEDNKAFLKNLKNWFYINYTHVLWLAKFVDDYIEINNDSQKFANFCYCLQSELNDLESLHNEPFIFSPVIGSCNGEIATLTIVNTQSANAVILLSLLDLLKTKTVVRKCPHCAKYFIPSSRSDEIYCDSCKKLSYDTLKQDNEIISEYRKIYKTQNARKQRNKENRPQINDYFDRWAEFAKKKRDECINGTITREEMIVAISGDSWMSGKGIE